MTTTVDVRASALP